MIFQLCATEYFDNYVLTAEPFAEALEILKTCVLINKNVCGKLFASLESLKTLYESFKVTSVLFFILNFNRLSYKLNNFTFKMSYQD